MERYLPQFLWDFIISADCTVTPGLDAGNQQYDRHGNKYEQGDCP